VASPTDDWIAVAGDPKIAAFQNRQLNELASNADV